MLGHECPNIQEPAAPLAEDEGGLHRSALALELALEAPASRHQPRIEELPAGTFAAVSAPTLDSPTLPASLWSPQESSSSVLPPVPISNASPSLAAP